MRIGFALRQERRKTDRASLSRSDDGSERRLNLPVLPSRHSRLGRPEAPRKHSLGNRRPSTSVRDYLSSLHDPRLAYLITPRPFKVQPALAGHAASALNW
jgi:hypothetical protein